MERLAELLFEDPVVDKHMTRVGIVICIFAMFYMGWHLWRWLI